MSSGSERTFGEPTPRSSPCPYAPFAWPAGKVLPLDAAIGTVCINLTAVLRERQTRRDFSALDLPRLATLLWLGFRTHSNQASPYGFELEYRPHPSGGAAHPIHLLVQRAAGAAWERYDPVRHALVEIRKTQRLADGARRHASAAVEPKDATLLALAAEPGKTASKYESPESLVWRDAGVVLGYLSLLTEALDLSFCPLGATGNDFVAPISARGHLQGTGLALLGGR